MPAYHNTFLPTDEVRIRERDKLTSLPRQFPENVVSDAQFQYAGERATIRRVTFYHGGLVLYVLEEYDGFWPEDWLDDAYLLDPTVWGFPTTADYYSIRAEQRSDHPYVVVYDPKGVECLAFRDPNNEQTARQMSQVAQAREMFKFEQRYAFVGTFDVVKETGLIRYWNQHIVWFVKVLSVESLEDIVDVSMRYDRLMDQKTDRQTSGEIIQARFFDATISRCIDALGMKACVVAECKYGKDRQCFRFINSVRGGGASLEIIASRGELI